MEKITLEQVAEAVKGQMLRQDSKCAIDKISTNSKHTGDSTLFVAIKGERFDGHDYIDDFLQNGGKAVISQYDTGKRNVILVKDTRLALGDLARYYRQKFNLPVIGITGSVGKTSTRGMIDSVLSIVGSTCSTKGNLNNDIGLPLTLLELAHTHEYAIIEMGMNHFGEIGYLSVITNPDVAVITNIGTAHIGNLGSQEGILKAKLEILEGLSSDALVVLNGDDRYLFSCKNKIPFRTVFYGIDNMECDVIACNVELDALQSTFYLKGHMENPFIIKTPGKHHVYNALAAVAIGLEYNMSLEQIKRGIQNFEPGNMRQNIIEIQGIRIIEDCYNANADSMKAAIEVLAASDTGGRKIAILGNMFELGDYTESEHRLVGEYIVRHNIDMLITVGNYAGYIAEQAGLVGIEAVSFSNNQDALKYIQDKLREKDTILIKASRSAKFEEISRGIQTFYKIG